ncbi:MAG TPA: hypothetical protein VK788_06800 [Terriglobales bacterium]|jgi:hypothetical protein|nr:hypothetical protein [Terriglobales bacterium]
MLTTEAVEKAIEMYEGGATEAAVTEATEAAVMEATGISRSEAQAVADAFNLGETERLLREVTLAGVLEAAAHALRSGRGLIGDGAGDVVREIWHNYPGAGMKVGAPRT